MPTALVLGSARNVFADAEAALAIFTPTCVAACNNMGNAWEGRVDHWFTLHPNQTPEWPGMQEARRRRKMAKRNDPVTWAHKPGPGIDKIESDDWGGSTGLFAVKVVLLELQFYKIVLAGMPMNKVGGHYDIKHEWHKAEFYHRGWRKHFKELQPFVRSMSGWTKELFGEPTKQWFAEPVTRRLK